MSQITEEFIQQCALKLGQFNHERVNDLVMLFYHQNACAQLNFLPNNSKEKFENLLTIKKDDNESQNDTPLTRIELQIIIDFKEKYLRESANDNDSKQKKSNTELSIYHELQLAYCYLLAQIDDLSSKKHLKDLIFLFKMPSLVYNLFDMYTQLGGNFHEFFSLIIQSGYLAKELVMADRVIRNFQLFIKRYQDFLITFEKNYKLLPDNTDNNSQLDAILNKNVTHEKSSFMTRFLSPTSIPMVSSTSIGQSPEASVSPPPMAQSSSSSHIPQKGLCVIINIKNFTSSNTPERAGSDKDVELIKVVFKNLKFTIDECTIDFKKTDLDRALDQIDNKDLYGHFDCLVIFIMSHGLLHSIYTADSQEVIIRDIVKRYSDSSPTTIWVGKPRLFFIQACRSPWPEHCQRSDREQVKLNDLSPRMLVSYSCSANEASKRKKTQGSIFIQTLCIMLVHYSRQYSIQTILDWTARFVIKRDEFDIECCKKPITIQHPEFIEREFSSNFRFSSSCLYDKYRSWIAKDRAILSIPLEIWEYIDSIVFNKIRSNQ